MSHLFVDTFFDFGVVENFVYRARITVILTSQNFIYHSMVAHNVREVHKHNNKTYLIK